MLYLNALGIVSPLGPDCQSTLTAFSNADAGGMQRDDHLLSRPITVGRVAEPLAPLPDNRAEFASRNNRLLWTACTQILTAIEHAVASHGRERVGVILGTSTSGIAEGEADYTHYLEHGRLPDNFHYGRQELGAPARFLRQVLDLTGPAYVISTACSSSGKTFSAGARLINAGLCDAVIVGGADSLCRMAISGFESLQSIAAERCNPMSRNRDGINIGEAAAVFLLSREPADIQLLGVGESTDAHHPNAPDPQGHGARLAMQAALDNARLAATDIDYINLHGTATRLNDHMESHAVSAVLGDTVAASSSKPLTGHALGAASALEAALLWLSLMQLENGAPVPPHCWDGEPDPELAALNLIDADQARLPTARRAAMMSNSFAFGGSNVTLILGRGWPESTA
ncbi:3-oxoacyl-[acyl-carrier-protein] synthase-1 [Methylohalomonas lacus]|uniref:3-oxoacyl-[acyl-carrier-protein] synthase-1 n=1 Tax=Methylohalomonas lacus TaxID=398773 RepID=A0AAE3HJN4_9GAMM|nr:beta-ketoacyl-[acyl-carrier-protein] synthase family protein [Methylohalomonas lacus]MCS3902356.1 3-oxoacyl-[acyl-carrier-protein] synthase-1 [Methylohalomonas lacus]